jgi:hypothetical protein
MSEDDRSNVIEIHPSALKRMLSYATELREFIKRGDLSGDHAVSEAFRFFIESVTIFKPEGWRKEPAVEIHSPWLALNSAPPSTHAFASGLSGADGSGGPIQPFPHDARPLISFRSDESAENT